MSTGCKKNAANRFAFCRAYLCVKNMIKHRWITYYFHTISFKNRPVGGSRTASFRYRFEITNLRKRYLVTEVLIMWEVSMGGSHSPNKLKTNVKSQLHNGARGSIQVLRCASVCADSGSESKRLWLCVRSLPVELWRNIRQRVAYYFQLILNLQEPPETRRLLKHLPIDLPTRFNMQLL
jgi:hypothetical protein